MKNYDEDDEVLSAAHNFVTPEGETAAEYAERLEKLIHYRRVRKWLTLQKGGEMGGWGGLHLTFRVSSAALEWAVEYSDKLGPLDPGADGRERVIRECAEKLKGLTIGHSGNAAEWLLKQMGL
jgi:hypothetical protein